jgi:hypothetical protein
VHADPKQCASGEKYRANQIQQHDLLLLLLLAVIAGGLVHAACTCSS